VPFDEKPQWGEPGYRSPYISFSRPFGFSKPIGRDLQGEFYDKPAPGLVKDKFGKYRVDESDPDD